MKKILSLILALCFTLCLSIPAFAADAAHEPYVKDEIFTPGSKLAFHIDWLALHAEGGPYTFTEKLLTSNYKVTMDLESGESLISDCYIDDDVQLLFIKLKPNYRQYQEKTVSGNISLRDRETRNTYTIPISFYVNNYIETIHFSDRHDEIDMYADDNTIYEVSDESPYGNLYLWCNDGDTEVRVRVYEDERFYLENNNHVMKEILWENEDVDEIRFVNFVASPSFSSNATIYFHNTEKDWHIYEVGKDDNLVEIGQWDEDEDCFTHKTRNLTSYVIADAPLKGEEQPEAPIVNSTPPADDKTNPNTGAIVKNPDTGAPSSLALVVSLCCVPIICGVAIFIKKKTAKRDML